MDFNKGNIVIISLKLFLYNDKKVTNLQDNIERVDCTFYGLLDRSSSPYKKVGLSDSFLMSTHANNYSHFLIFVHFQENRRLL